MNVPIKVKWSNQVGVPDINRLTPDEALMLAKHKYKSGMLVEGILKSKFVISPNPKFQYIESHGYLYVNGMAIFDFELQRWARIISGPKDPITKEQKQHLINLIKSI